MRNWRVFRLIEDQVVATVSEPLDPDAAQRRAGRLRDEMTDDEVGKGVNYVADRDAVVGGIRP